MLKVKIKDIDFDFGTFPIQKLVGLPLEYMYDIVLKLFKRYTVKNGVHKFYITDTKSVQIIDATLQGAVKKLADYYTMDKVDFTLEELYNQIREEQRA